MVIKSFTLVTKSAIVAKLVVNMVQYKSFSFKNLLSGNENAYQCYVFKHLV